MVNVLEGLYIITAIALLAAGIQFARGRRMSARRFLWFGVIGAGVALLLYLLLTPAA